MTSEFYTKVVSVSPAEQKQDICIAFPVALSMWLSSLHKLLSIFLCIGHFLMNYKARAMKLGSWIGLEE